MARRLRTWRWAAAVLGALLAAEAPAAEVWPSDPGVNVPIDGIYAPVFPLVSDGEGGVIVSSFRSCGCRDEGTFHLQRVSTDGFVSWGDWVGPQGRIGLGSSTKLLTVPDGQGGVFYLMKLFFGVYPNGYAFWLQHVDFAGQLLFGPIGIIMESEGQPMEPIGAVSDGAGGGVFVWVEYPPPGSSFELHAQRFDRNGVEQWPYGTFFGYDILPLDAHVPSGDVVPDGTGGVIVAGNALDTYLGDVGVRAWRIDGNGIRRWDLPGIPIATLPGLQDQVQMVPDVAGGAAIVWRDQRAAPEDTLGDIYAQRVDTAGVVLWGANGIPVAALPTGTEDRPAAVSDGVGGLIVAWQERGAEADGDLLTTDLYAQHLDAAGGTLWGAAGRPVVARPGDQVEPAMCTDQAGGALLVWADGRALAAGDSAAGADIYAQRLDAAGEHQWTFGGAPVSTRPGDQFTPRIFPRVPGEGIVVFHTRTPAQVLAQRVPISGVVAALGSLVRAEATSSGVRLLWNVADAGVPVEVERRAGEAPWRALASVLPDGAGGVAFDDRDVRPGARLGYRLVQAGAAFAEAWVDVPAETRFALQGARPNPVAGRVRVALALPVAAPARLELLDLGGRRVRARTWPDLGAGTHLLDLGPSADLAAGIYVVRLTQQERTASSRITVIR